MRNVEQMCMVDGHINHMMHIPGWQKRLALTANSQVEAGGQCLAENAPSAVALYYVGK